MRYIKTLLTAASLLLAGCLVTPSYGQVGVVVPAPSLTVGVPYGYVAPPVYYGSTCPDQWGYYWANCAEIPFGVDVYPFWYRGGFYGGYGRGYYNHSYGWHGGGRGGFGGGHNGGFGGAGHGGGRGGHGGGHGHR
jgi:hypothetical protein